jgi:hypothetical protein
MQSETVQQSQLLQVKSEFGISLSPGINNDLLNYGVITKNGTAVFKSMPLSEQSFVMQITGKMSSLANPKLKNLLKENVLDTCDCIIDPLYKKYEGFDCYPLTILWKIRYKYDPRYHNLKEYEEEYKGWAFYNYGPNKKQCAYLMDRYKIKSIDEYITGPNLYQLLKDVQDSTWVAEYFYLPE